MPQRKAAQAQANVGKRRAKSSEVAPPGKRAHRHVPLDTDFQELSGGLENPEGREPLADSQALGPTPLGGAQELEPIGTLASFEIQRTIALGQRQTGD